AAISMENARLYTGLKESRDQMSRWNQTLEQTVDERTRDLKQINQQLEEEIAERRQVEDALRVMDDSRRLLLSNISHELKTPITSIQGFLETILDEVIDDPRQQKKYLRLVLNKVLHLNRLIQDLFELTKLEA
ncbi:histidine kinase dimerization/phospho-acceptor domain-containing protein, partial [Desulfocucumis palustris]|uniref:histidine kinase dimerization/phospho-acceptor domain-containing protein n=1 Tax=Desulfocucumis palustris TaxID=1898651 RepID=UPI002738713B